jgi:3-hydroxybutyryl-CoA dehydrogenase
MISRETWAVGFDYTLRLTMASSQNVQRIGVLGAGTMGSGIAQVCVRAGLDVVLCDVSEAALERGLAAITAGLTRDIAKGRLTPQQAEEARGRIMTVTAPKALGASDLVIEAATERFEVKAELFRRLDRSVRPEVVLASNTSSISIARLAAVTGRPALVIGMHFFNPVPVMRLVEIVRGPQTSQASFEVVKGLAERLGKIPVEVKDSPGFVSNRVLMPLINEACYAVMEGVATAEAVDTIFREGMAHPMGPLTLADLIGLDVCVDIMRVLEEGFGDAKYSPCPLLVRMVAEGRLGKKSGGGFYTYPPV